MSAELTDTQMLDWLEIEGLESVIRLPLFDNLGRSTGGVLWLNHWTNATAYATMRESILAGWRASEAEYARNGKRHTRNVLDGVHS